MTRERDTLVEINYSHLWLSQERTALNGNMLGADPAQLRALAELLSNSSARLHNTASSLHPAVMNARWQGPDANRFRADWASKMRPQLQEASRFLDSTARSILAQAKEQEDASAVGSEGNSGPSTPSVINPGESATYTIYQRFEVLKDGPKEDMAAWWNTLTPAQQKSLLAGKDENKIPNALYIAALGERLSPEDQKAANEVLIKNASASIPLYNRVDKIGVDGQVMWVHGGAHIASTITQNADGSATLKVSGDLGGGANTPGTKGGVNATLTGELGKSYRFDSLAQAQAALNQMTKDLPPDNFGKAKDAISNPAGYLVDALDNAAHKNGSVSQFDTVKGTVSVGASGKLGDDVKGSAKLDMAYEQNLSNGESTASVTAKADAKLDLGDGTKFGGSGEAGIKVQMNSDHEVTKLSLSLRGTVEGSADVRQQDPTTPMALPGAGAPTPNEGPSIKASAGVQGSLQMEIYNTKENSALIQSYLGNTAAGNDAAAASDLAKIYHASGTTLQLNTVTKSEANLVDFDSGAASLKVGSSTEQTTNVSTGYKAPYSENYNKLH